MRRRFSLWLLLVWTFISPVFSGEGSVIATLDKIQFATPKEKARAELIDGKIGKANQFHFDKDARSAFFTSNIRGTPGWDEAEGLSFWVKGDGSNAFGGIQLIYDDDYAVRYDYAFPIQSKEWTNVTVAWKDFVPVLPGPKSKPLDAATGNLPSKVSGLWIGKWWYWGEYPAHGFALDDIRLKRKVKRDEVDYRPRTNPLQRTMDKLKTGDPIIIVTMGDSLTDFKHWANRSGAWPILLKDKLEGKYKSKVTIHNPALGGTQLRQNMVLISRWHQRVPEPDLVTIQFGANDWEAGMRGKQFHGTCIDAIDRVRRATRGKADVMLLTTMPGLKRWDTMKELAEACRQAAKDRNTGLADTEQAFHEYEKTARAKFFVEDQVHLGAAGHALVAATVQKALEGK